MLRTIPAFPTRQQAEAALQLLDDLLDGIPFVSIWTAPWRFPV